MRHGTVEIRERGKTLYGTLVREGRAARERRELFAPGSVYWPSEGVGIALAHHHTPVLSAMPRRESDGRITIEAKATSEIRSAVESGRRFLSIEFFPKRENRTRGGIREILSALVDVVALVPDPEYSTSAEVRQRFTGGLRTFIPINRRADCRCAGQGAGKGTIEIEFEAGAWDDVLGEVAAGDRNISAISKGAGEVVADTATGSLALESGRRGLRIHVDPLDTEAGRGVEELVAAGVGVFARPVIDFDESEFTVSGTAAIVSKAAFNFVLVKPTDRTRGLDPLEPVGRGEARSGLVRVRPLDAVERILALPEHRRVRVWLVTRSLAELAADVRLGDGSAEPTGATLVVLKRVAATAAAMVLHYAPDAPDELHDEALARLSGYLLDSDPSGRSAGGPIALRSSGAASILRPYRDRRGGLIG